MQGGLSIDLLSIAILTEGLSASTPSAVASTSIGGASRRGSMGRGEAFTISLTKVSVQLEDSPERNREIIFSIRDGQLDLQRPGPAHVLLRSTTRPFLQTRSRRDDVASLDVHLRNVEVTLGELELSIADSAWEQLRLVQRQFLPESSGLTFEEVLLRSSIPYHLSRLEPPSETSKLILDRLNVSSAKVTVWCDIYLPDAYYLPRTLRDTIQMVSFFATTLTVKGASVQVPQQKLFSERSPCEGSLSAVFARISQHYLPHLKASWRSLLQHSNIFLGGLLSQATWAPRQREACQPQPPVCQVTPSGELLLSERRPVVKAVSKTASRGGSTASAKAPPPRQSSSGFPFAMFT
eukprot:TRINITY_DN16796_c1_g1_i1.p1 TRINITY_DN16796_c1_g1~~TRINITY_DN16796_c1_g1_i1.p1  ORF type:complete len:376 (+),score=62.82 TRINITY_DN16796_c1_g1_i1:77-1129(+)